MAFKIINLLTYLLTYLLSNLAVLFIYVNCRCIFAPALLVTTFGTGPHMTAEHLALLNFYV